MTAQKASKMPALATAPARARVRQLVPVKLSRVEWQLVIATMEVGRMAEGSDDKSWIWVLSPQLGDLAEDIAEQAGVRIERGTGGLGMVHADAARILEEDR